MLAVGPVQYRHHRIFKGTFFAWAWHGLSLLQAIEGTRIALPVTTNAITKRREAGDQRSDNHVFLHHEVSWGGGRLGSCRLLIVVLLIHHLALLGCRVLCYIELASGKRRCGERENESAQSGLGFTVLLLE